MQSLSFSEEYNHSQVISFLQTNAQERPIFITPNVPDNYAKLGYQQIFYQKDNKIIVKELTSYEKPTIEHFQATKKKHDKGIRKFKSMFNFQESENMKRRKRGNSIDNETIGAYYLNNWQSNEDYICQKPPPEEKTVNIVYEIIGMRWTKAIQILLTLPRTTQTATLEYILNGFRAISALFTEEDRFLSDHFLERSKYDISIKKSSENVGGYYNFVNVLESDAKEKFMQMKNIPRKIEILKINFDYLVKFASQYRPTMQDQYLQLAFKILGNQYDQELTIQSEQHDFLKILLKLDLKLPDRLNFATKLLTERKRKQFCLQLQEKLCHFPRLQNIWFYTCPPLSKQKEERVQQICKSYLDEFSDLEIVAHLATEHPFLKKYYFQFRQALQLSCQHKKLERLQHRKWSSQKELLRVEESRRPHRQNASFFEYLNVAQQRISDWKNVPNNHIVCQICCKKMLKTQNFLECGKCRHGGHINHLIKWFQDYQNCPHIGCPCICN